MKIIVAIACRGVPKELQRSEIVLTVNTKEDLNIMRKIYKNLSKPNSLIKIKDATKFLDKHPKLKRLYKKEERPHAWIWN